MKQNDTLCGVLSTRAGLTQAILWIKELPKPQLSESEGVVSR